MNNNYGIFFRDKDGYELILSDEFGKILAYSNYDLAEKELALYKEKLYNALYPKMSYRKVKKFFKTTLVPVEPIRLPQWKFDLYKQQYNTIFLKTVKIV